MGALGCVVLTGPDEGNGIVRQVTRDDAGLANVPIPAFYKGKVQGLLGSSLNDACVIRYHVQNEAIAGVIVAARALYVSEGIAVQVHIVGGADNQLAFGRWLHFGVPQSEGVKGEGPDRFDRYIIGFDEVKEGTKVRRVVHVPFMRLPTSAF